MSTASVTCQYQTTLVGFRLLCHATATRPDRFISLWTCCALVLLVSLVDDWFYEIHDSVSTTIHGSRAGSRCTNQGFLGQSPARRSLPVVKSRVVENGQPQESEAVETRGRDWLSCNVRRPTSSAGAAPDLSHHESRRAQICQIPRHLPLLGASIPLSNCPSGGTQRVDGLACVRPRQPASLGS